MDYKAKYEQWCQDPIFDKETKAELSAIRSWNQPDECVYGDQGNAGSG